MLILPGDPLFDATLACPPPNWKAIAAQYSGSVSFIARAGTGILEPCSTQDLDEYLQGGEYEERLLDIGDEEVYLEAFGDAGELEYWVEQNYGELENAGDCYAESE